MSIRPNKSQTSTGDFLVHLLIDRKAGRTITGNYPSFDLTMSDSSLSLTTHWESVTQLEDIASFYSNLSPEKIVPVIPASSIRGKLRAIQPVPPIVLEP